MDCGQVFRKQNKTKPKKTKEASHYMHNIKDTGKKETEGIPQSFRVVKEKQFTVYRRFSEL